MWPSCPAKGAQQSPLFSAHVCCGQGRPYQLLLSSCINAVIVAKEEEKQKGGCDHGYQGSSWNFYDLLLRSYLYHCVWSTIRVLSVGYNTICRANCDPLFQSRHIKMSSVLDYMKHCIDYCYFIKSLHLKYPKNVEIWVLISFHYCTRINPLHSGSKLTVHCRWPTRFIAGPAISRMLSTLAYSRCCCNSNRLQDSLLCVILVVNSYNVR